MNHARSLTLLSTLDEKTLTNDRNLSKASRNRGSNDTWKLEKNSRFWPMPQNTMLHAQAVQSKEKRPKVALEILKVAEFAIATLQTDGVFLC